MRTCHPQRRGGLVGAIAPIYLWVAWLPRLGGDRLAIVEPEVCPESVCVSEAGTAQPHLAAASAITAAITALGTPPAQPLKPSPRLSARSTYADSSHSRRVLYRRG